MRGAGRGIRTPDFDITNVALYQLSYTGTFFPFQRITSCYSRLNYQGPSAPMRQVYQATVCFAGLRSRTRITTSTLACSVPRGRAVKSCIEIVSGSMSINSPESML